MGGGCGTAELYGEVGEGEGREGAAGCGVNVVRGVDEACAREIDFVKRVFKLSSIVYNKLTLWVNLLRAVAWRFPSKRIN